MQLKERCVFVIGRGQSSCRWNASYRPDYYACTLPSGKKRILVAQVVVGLWEQGAKGLSACPLLPGDKYQLYNSLVNRLDNPSTFVVQHGSQALLVYVIEYH